MINSTHTSRCPPPQKRRRKKSRGPPGQGTSNQMPKAIKPKSPWRSESSCSPLATGEAPSDPGFGLMDGTEPSNCPQNQMENVNFETTKKKSGWPFGRYRFPRICLCVPGRFRGSRIHPVGLRSNLAQPGHDPESGLTKATGGSLADCEVYKSRYPKISSPVAEKKQHLRSDSW